MSGIFWLASYPKSGNTWLRIFLENYVQAASESVSINSLPPGTVAYQRELLDEWLGLESAELTDSDVDRFRPRVYERLMRERAFRYVKTHEQYRRNACGESVFSDRATAGVVLLVRNPLDVAVSLAKFMCISIDEAIGWMSDETYTLYPQSNFLCNHIPQLVGSWSTHAESWLNSGCSVHVSRYEDLLADPHRYFGAIVRFLGFSDDAQRLDAAIENSNFANLQSQEAQSGFRELWTGASEFFRQGRAGAWKNILTDDQCRAIQASHARQMRYFQYCGDSL